jgi:sulfatase maturation enzyme AslB (radical SAM superfamily)
MKHFISPADYRVFAGPDWPSYDAVVQGELGSDPGIQQEVTEFVRMMQENYAAQTLRGDAVAEANQQRQRQVFFDKQYQGQPCAVPWTTLGVNKNGDVFICSSPSWIPRFVGNVLQCDSIYDVLNSDTAQSIRQEILAGRYTYCNNRICNFFAGIPRTEYRTQGAEIQPQPVVTKPELLVKQIPRNIIFDFDYTCNFRCPSCRTELINNNRHHVIRPINDRIVAALKTLVIDEIQQQPVEIRWCGGEPFISDVYLDLLDYIVSSGKTNIQHVIQTNGSYLQKKADLVQALLPTVREMRVSFDAATASTYQQIRVNGQWDQLLDNVRWLRQQINDQGTTTTLSADFVVQRANYKEIPAFVELCRDLGIDHINWQKMWNWGTWSQPEFDHNNVYDVDHELYADLRAQFALAQQPMSLT